MASRTGWEHATPLLPELDVLTFRGSSATLKRKDQRLDMKTRWVLGIDISLAHGAFVQLCDGKLHDCMYVTDKKAVADKDRHHENYLAASKIKDMQLRDFERLVFWSEFIEIVMEALEPEYVGIEDFAYRAPQSAHQIGEISGIVRLSAYSKGLKLRLHDPMTLKMFACHEANLDAKTTRVMIEERWPEAKAAFSRYVSGKDERTLEDLCDAYALAKLVDLEIQLRAGTVRLDSLHEKEVQVFNRCTKRYPESLLAREWIQKIDG